MRKTSAWVYTHAPKGTLWGKRTLSLLLSLVLCLSLLPGAASAAGDTGSADTGKAIRLGTSGITGYDSAAGYDYIYYGTWNESPIKWRVLDDKTNFDSNNDGINDDGLFLLSDASLCSIPFQESNHYVKSEQASHKGADPANGDHTNCQLVKTWQGSDAQAWCRDFAGEEGAGTEVPDAFTAGERNAILPTTKSDDKEDFLIYGEAHLKFDASVKILSGDKVFFLSVEEVKNGDYGFTDNAARIAYDAGGDASSWWLRSPSASSTIYVGYVRRDGVVDKWDASSPNLLWSARPAFNLDRSSVLFVSAAEGGKADAAVDGNLTAVGTGTGEWKLTLRDSSRSFSVTGIKADAITEERGGSVEITYTGAGTDENEYVSAMLCDSNDNVLYYGNIAQSSTSGAASVTIPDGLAAGNYTLKVFSEQCNGDKKTDYASSFQNIRLTVEQSIYNVTLYPNGGTVNSGNVTEYTYGVGATLPTDVKREGYTFKGWYDNAALIGSPVTTIGTTDTGNKECWAKWEANTYNISYELNGGTNHENNPATYTYGVGVPELNAPTKPGYRFDGWYAEEDFSGDLVTAISATDSGDKTFYAKWTRNSSGGGSVSTYAISVDEAANGSVSADRKTASRGATVTVTVAPDKGYALETLTVTDKDGKALTLTDKGDGKYTFTMPASKVTVKATFLDDNTMLNFFVDVKAGDYFYDAVLWAVQNGVTTGTTETTFSPNASCTRAQIVTFLWRAAGSPEPQGASSFTDVPADGYYAKAVAWAVENGVTTGMTETTFSPDDTCTRAQAVAFLFRYAAPDAVTLQELVSGFGDADAVPAYALPAMNWALAAGIVQGDGENLMPNDTCTRAQIVTLLWRTLT